MDVVTIAEVNKAAQSPELRKDLFQRISEQRNLKAFEVLYGLYFGNMWTQAFHQQERRVMQEVVGEVAVKMLSDGGENVKSAIAIMLEYQEPPPIEVLDLLLHWFSVLRFDTAKELRNLAATALLKFLPTHPDIFTLDSLPKRITVAMIGETGQIFRVLDDLLCAVKERYAKTQAESEPD